MNTIDVSNMSIVKMGAGAILLVVAGIYGMSGVTSIEPGEYGVLVKNLGSNRGMQKEGLGTGIHWVEPFQFDVVVYDTRAQQYRVETETDVGLEATTQDGQPINVDVSLEISLDRDKVPTLHERVGPDWYLRIVYPKAREVIREATSLQKSDAIYTGAGRTFVQRHIQEAMRREFSGRGLLISANMRDIRFENKDYVQVLETKAKAAQEATIQERLAEAAEQEAIKVANTAEGQKQKRIKEAEAGREELRLQGEGQRLQQEEQAKGILAVGTANAEVTRLRNESLQGPGGDRIVELEWAKNLGPNVKVYGVPTGAPGTSSFMFDEALRGVLGSK